MIDLHCHLLPNFDDGSQSMEASLEQVKRMAEGGVTHAFLTSHYMRGHYEYTKDHYMGRFNEFVSEVKHQNIEIVLLPGFEVHLHPGIEEIVEREKLFLGDSRYLLVESDLNGLPIDFYKNAFMLLRKGYKPILAHAERYVTVMKHTSSEAKTLLQRNIYLQVNSGSLRGLYGDKVKETAWKLVSRGYAHFVSSDDHVRTDYTSFFNARKSIINRIDSHTAELLCTAHSMKVVQDKDVPYHYVNISYSQKDRKKKGFLKSLLGF